MITSSPLNRFGYLGRAMALPVAFITFCAFSLNFNQNVVASPRPKSVTMDTVPIVEFMKIDLSQVAEFQVNTETAILTMKDRKKIMVERKVLDEYMAPAKADQGGPDKKNNLDQVRDRIFTKVETEAEYPGGVEGWKNYLNSTFKYPQEAIKKNIEGTVIVQFIVDEKGNLSDIHALSGPTVGKLREETVRVIKNSGNWLPAIQNGLKVKSYKKQPISFKLKP